MVSSESQIKRNTTRNRMTYTKTKDIGEDQHASEGIQRNLGNKETKFGSSLDLIEYGIAIKPASEQSLLLFFVLIVVFVSRLVLATA